MIFGQFKTCYDMHDLWGAALPKYGGGGMQSGIVFPHRRSATLFSDTFRGDPFRYTPPGEQQVVRRAAPPRNDMEKRRGRLATKLCEALYVGNDHGRLRTAYPRTGLPKAFINIVKECGRLEQLARVELNAAGDELSVTGIFLYTKYAGEKAVLAKLRMLSGTAPQIEDSDSDATMSGGAGVPDIRPPPGFARNKLSLGTWISASLRRNPHCELSAND